MLKIVMSQVVPSLFMMVELCEHIGKGGRFAVSLDTENSPENESIIICWENNIFESQRNDARPLQACGAEFLMRFVMGRNTLLFDGYSCRSAKELGEISN